MSLLGQTMRASPLLGERRTRFTRTRLVMTGRNPTTGAPITTPTNGRVDGWFTWATPDTKQDLHADAIAYILTTPKQLRPGDTIRHADYGSFLVLEGGVKPYGPHDRAELRRSGA